MAVAGELNAIGQPRASRKRASQQRPYRVRRTRSLCRRRLQSKSTHRQRSQAQPWLWLRCHSWCKRNSRFHPSGHACRAGSGEPYPDRRRKRDRFDQQFRHRIFAAPGQAVTARIDCPSQGGWRIWARVFRSSPLKKLDFVQFLLKDEPKCHTLFS